MQIDGTWYNELNSTMQLTTAPDGSLRGQYTTGVPQPTGPYTLTGRYDTTQNTDVTLTFCVSWNGVPGNFHSATGWSGLYQQTPSGEQITALWLLCTSTPLAQDWQSTKVGQDVFKRTMRTQKEIDERLGRVSASHPTHAADA